jgi:thioredoxin 1
MSSGYSKTATERTEIEALEGLVVLDFGTDWCGHCRAAEPLIAAALAQQPALRHIRIEDGKGRPLGRSYGVKLWPTLIFLNSGREIARVVRPADTAAIERAAATLSL